MIDDEVFQLGLESPSRYFEYVGQNIYLAKVTRVDAKKYRVDVTTLGEGDQFDSCRIAGRVFWMPQLGDIVIVAFLDDTFSNPIVMSKILFPKDDVVSQSDPEGIHGKHVIKDSDENVKASLEWSTDAEGNLTLNVGGLSGNLTIVTDGEVNINNGSKGAARVGDKVKIIIPAGSVVTTPGSPTFTGLKNTTALEFEGTIEEGSEKVKVG